MNRIALAGSFLLFLATSAVLEALPPDLTNGGVPTDSFTNNNLGPTGLAGWVYSEKLNNVFAQTTNARQFQINSVDPGSPADGLIQVNDVILGASGTGATPTNFTYDARKSLAAAINDAEARNPAILKLLVWRAGATSVVNLTLQYLGSYSATAPYNCPKSALILERAVQKSMTVNEDTGYQGIGSLLLLAANDPSNSNNVARQAKAAATALSLIPSQDKIDKMMNGWVDYLGDKPSWPNGHKLITLGEYYLSTGDTRVLPAIQAIANMVANGADLYGAYGHGFATDVVPSLGSTRAVRIYGPVNSTGLPCFLGMVLARKCGVATPVVEATIEKCNDYYGSYVNRSSIPYGENQPDNSFDNGSNGKTGVAALAFSLQPDRGKEAHYFAELSAAASCERENGHSNAYFNQLWTPLGAAVGGEQAAIEFFARIHWMIDLNRTWDGGFDYNALTNEWIYNNTPAYRGTGFPMDLAAGLVYALPLKKIVLTGKYVDPSLVLNTSELQEAALADGYKVENRAATRTNAQLLQDIASFSGITRNIAAQEIAARTADKAYFLSALTSMLGDPTTMACRGACLALGYIADPSTIQQTVNLLTCSDSGTRWAAAQALRYYSHTDTISYVNQIMDAVIANQKPMLPIDPVDPLQSAQGMIASLLFYNGNASGPKGILSSSIDGVDRSRLYQVIRIFSQLPSGNDRSQMNSALSYLTQEDVKQVAGPLMDVAAERAPANIMNGFGVQFYAAEALQRSSYAEAVPLEKTQAEYYKGIVYATTPLGDLQAMAGGCLKVQPDPKILDFCDYLIHTKLQPDAAQAVIDAINADTNPTVLTPLKGITSLTADSPVLTLPVNRTVLRAQTYNYGSESIFTWRKVHGPGSVTFAPYASPDDGSRTVIFDGVPGNYLFELTLGDSRKLTEVKQTVAVRLEMAGGGLPANSPPMANAQSLTASQGVVLPVTLSGSDPEGYELSYSITSQPTHGQLTGTPPLMRYVSDSSYLGADSFSFQVMDSEGQVSSATISITVNNSNAVGLAIYAPYNYTPGSLLNGKSSADDVGFAAPWVAYNSITVQAGSLGNGDILTKGGQIANALRHRANRAISTSALKDRGLLNDGATLWFSGYFGTHAGVNSTNGSLAIALANSAFPSSSYNTEYWIQNEGSQLGSGIGFTLFGYYPGAVPRATEFRDQSQGTGSTGMVFGSWEGYDWNSHTTGLDPGARMVSGEQQDFYVGKITWGAAPNDVDRIEIYQTRDPNVLPGQPCSILETKVDQTKFDTLTIQSNNYYAYDEIRFGESYHSVIAGSVASTTDVSPPTPNPLGFYQAPHVSGLGSISMTAMTASDLSGVQYYFTCTAGGGHDSGWQSGRDYTDTGLTPGVAYSYTVKTRDLSVAKNTSSASAAFSATIPATWVVLDTVGLTSVSAESLITQAGLTVGNVTYTYDSSIPKGIVISQSLTAGSSVSTGSAMDLVVSLGSPVATVPNVVGQAQATAQSNIVAANLTVGTITQQHSTTVPAGSVISQSLTAGTIVASGSAVDLVVSLGLAPNTVPDVVGLAQATAQSNILAANLIVGRIAQQYSATVPAGSVISQGLAAGSIVLYGSAMDLVVSLGPPPPTTVPNVVGQAQATAQSNILAANLAVGTITLQYGATVPAGSVISQGLTAGSSVPQGSAVDLVISSGAAYYWDSNSTTGGFGSANGTWGSSTFWSTSSAGTGTTANTTIAATDDVTFGTSSKGYTGTVTLNGDKTANSLTVGGGTGAGAITFLGDTAARKLTLGTGITMNAGAGAVTFGNGTASKDVVLTLPTTTSQTTQLWTNNASSNLTINTSAAITRSTGNALAFIKTGTGNFAIGTSVLPNNVSTGIMGTWAFFGTGANTKYAYNNAGTIAAFTGTAASDGSGLTDTTGFLNYDLADATGTVPATVSANTIRYTGSGGTTAPGATSFTVNGLLNAGSGLWTIGTNNLTIGSDKELVINAATNDITISSVIVNNSGGASALTKLGTGTLTLSGPNTFTGAIRILDGIVKAGANGTTNAGPFGKSANVGVFLANTSTAGLDINGFNVFIQALSGGGASGGNVTLSTGNTLSITSPNATYAGVISGGGNLQVYGTQKQTLSGLNTYTGTTTIGNNTGFGAFISVNTLANGGSNSGIGASSSDASNFVFNGAGNFEYSSSVDANTDRLFTLSGASNDRLQTGSTGALNFTNTGAIVVTGGAKNLILTSTSTGNGSIAASIGDGTGATSIQKGSTTTASSNTWSLTNQISNFTGTITSGTTTVSAGTLAYSSAGGTNPISFLQTTGSGTISYIGSANRTMSGAITATALIGGTITLDSSGLGAVNYSNTGSLGNSAGSGAKGLVLSGTNIGNNILAGKWEDNAAGGAATLTKNGPGTWILSGANSHTGPTAVTAGKLFINGDQSSATGNVTVSTDATLGGTGVIGGNTTIASGGKLEFDLSGTAASHDPLNVAAGRNFAFSGTSTLTITTSGRTVPGIYTLVTGGNNITGSAPATLNLPAGWSATVSISGNSLLLNVAYTGIDITPPTVVSITDDTGGSSVVANTTVNYTVTFSKDMDASTVSAVDFGNAGTAFCDIGMVTGTSPGVFLVPVTPTSAGSLRLSINAGADLQDLAANSLDTASPILDDTTITVTPPATGSTPYSDWAATNAPNGTPTDDYDGDGVSNALEFVLGGSASTNDLSKLPTISTSGGNMIFTFHRDQTSINGSTAVTIEVGTDLATWPATSYTVPDVATAGPPLTVVKDTSPGMDTVTLSVAQSPDVKKFARLKVVVTP